ncbi:MAG: restriction endonuclease subunit S [Aestuariivita sp.]|nr:restriction endonuclease subunit S [Aestuariivita sp.]
MLDQQPRYEDYKDSGIPWLGEIPADWLWERGKWHHRYQKILNSNGANYNVLSLTLRGVVNNDPNNPEGLVPNDYRTYQLFDKDDLVFKLIDLENVKTSRVGLVHENGIMSSAYIRLVPGSAMNSRFLYFFYYSLYQAEVFNKLGAGVRSTLNQTDLLDLSVPIIDLATQNRIVDFLDAKTAEIDTAIDKKRRLIELLDEKRVALITETVIQQIDPDTGKRSVGSNGYYYKSIEDTVKWRRLRHIAEIKNSNVDKLVIGGEHSVQLCNYLDVYRNDFINADMKFSQGSATAKEIAIFALLEGDVIITKDSEDKADIGVPALVQSTAADLLCGYHLSILRPKSGIVIGPYLFWAILSNPTREAFSNAACGVTRFGLTLQGIKSVSIPLPDLATQNRIVDFLNEKTAEIDAAISKEQRMIDLLNEFKQILIANAVTGKIKI